MEPEERKIKNIKIKGDFIEVTVLVHKEKIFNRERLLEYDALSRMQKEIVSLLSAEIVKDSLEEIKKKVLANVDWPEIVRSDIAQKVVKAIATGQFDERRY